MSQFLPPNEVHGRRGSYQLCADSLAQPLGAGARSSIYRVSPLARSDEAMRSEAASSTATELSYALKWGQGSTGEEFRREAECLALLQGQGVPLLIDVAPDGSSHQFLVLEELKGKSLDEFLIAEGSNLTDSQRVELGLRLLLSVGSALDHLHSFGLSHGDVKPQNIFIDERKRLTLIDFGFARPILDLQLGGGTPEYLPPETLRGAGVSPVERDTYALGLSIARIFGISKNINQIPIEHLKGSVGEIIGPIFHASPGTRPQLKWLIACAQESLAIGPHSAKEPPFQSDDLEWEQQVRRGYLRQRIVETSILQEDASLEIDLPEPAKGWLSSYFQFFFELTPKASDFSGEAKSGLAQTIESSLPKIRSSAVEEKSRNPITHRVERSSLATRQRITANLLGPFGFNYIQVEGTEAEFLTALLARKSAHLSALSLPIASGEMFKGVELIEISLRALQGAPDLKALSYLSSLEEWEPVLMLKVLQRLRQLALFIDARRVLKKALRKATSESFRAELLLEKSLLEMRSGQLSGVATCLALVKEEHLKQSSKWDLIALKLRLKLSQGLFTEILRTSKKKQPQILEVRALAHLYLGEINEAEAAIRLGLQLTIEPELQARLFSVQGMLLAHLGQHLQAASAYKRAAQWSEFESAPLESATYFTNGSTSEAALGHLATAIELSEKAELLFIALGKPEKAAYAILGQAACLAQFGARVQVELLVRRAQGLVRDDWICDAYLLLCQIDTEFSLEAWQRLVHLVEQQQAIPLELKAHLFARSLGENLPEVHFSKEKAELQLSREAKLELLIACARHYQRAGASGQSREIVSAYLNLPDYTHGASTVLSECLKLMQELESPFYRGRLAAAALRLADSYARLEKAGKMIATPQLLQKEFSLELQKSCLECRIQMPVSLTATFDALSWVELEREAVANIEPRQILDIDGLLRVLLSKRGLKALLEQALDMMLLWTGVSRGMILLRAPENKLVPRIARHIKRRDLNGEQLSFSRSIASRALQQRRTLSLVEFEQSQSEAQGSIAALNLRSVLAVPLIAEGESLGVAYLDDCTRRQAFGDSEKRWVNLIATVASIALLRERENIHLRRATGRARRASQRSLHRLERTDLELVRVRAALSETRDSHELKSMHTRLVSQSVEMKQLLSQLERVAKSDLTLLISGESGTGKELMARAACEWSERSEKPFIAENCAAIPANLLESTLFGHIKGAFTGAHEARRGIFELAHQGTLFLDEVGELPLELQSKLLRVLTEGSVRPLGAENEIQVNVRLLVATNRDLKQMVQAGSFREDLYYRLAVVPLHVPALRERREDILPLAEYFVARYQQKRGTVMSRRARLQLYHYQWPGNIRQLENEVRRACILADGELQMADFSPELQASSQSQRGESLKEKVDQLEMQLVVAALEQESGNISRSAVRLGLSRFGLQKMMKRLQISRDIKGTKLGGA